MAKDKECNKLIPEHIMLLSFNYTGTARMYRNFNLTHNYIHGELSNPTNIILGYGDELDKSYQDILDKNDNYYCPLNPKTTPLTFRKTEVWLSAYHGQAPFVKK